MKKIVFKVTKIKKDDTIRVMMGKDKGKEGKIIRVLAKKGQVIVSGVNKIKKHVKAQGKDRPGGIIELEKPLWVAKVALICPHCKKPTRVGFQIDQTKRRKIRVCKKCQGLIDQKGN